ncbi:MAG: Zn-dependent hydrolase [Bacteroidota bacterium]
MSKINTERLWQRLMDMAAIGATAGGGVKRLALTETDRQGRTLFMDWCTSAGLHLRKDTMGNLFARRKGLDPQRKAVLIGSHLDSQPSGGKYDGTLGVLAALEVIETLNDLNIATQAPLEIVSWTNEEGARFSPAMIGSGVFAGKFPLAYAYQQKDAAGTSLEQALQHIDQLGQDVVQAAEFAAALELHIEQGPVLEAAATTIGVVTAVQGIRWYRLKIIGHETHAGPCPMEMRQDPIRGLSELLPQLYKLQLSLPLSQEERTAARITVGELQAYPGSINTVPAEVHLSIDIRHPDSSILDQLGQALEQVVRQLASSSQLDYKLEAVWHSPPQSFDPACIKAVEQACQDLKLSHQHIVSGAGHDAVYLAKVIPTSMIFIPCRDGLSHNEAEHIEQEHAFAGTEVLLQAVLQLAN